jgi:arsenic resistance protein ArsH
MKRVSVSKLPDLPNVDAALFSKPAASNFKAVVTSTHAPRILLLYGSLRERSFSRLLTFEAERLLAAFDRTIQMHEIECCDLIAEGAACSSM